MLTAPIVWLALTLSQEPLSPLEVLDARVEADAAYAAGDWPRVVALHERLAASSPADGEVWRRLGIGRYYVGEYGRAAEAFERALAIGGRGTAFMQYSLASCYALVQDAEATMAAVEASLAAGLDDRGRFAADRDFLLLHDDPRWAEVTGALPEGDRDRDSGLRFDLDFLVAEARRLHAGPRRPAHSELFAEQAAALREAIPHRTDEQVLAGMMRLVASLGDGHSTIYGPDADTPLELGSGALPFSFYWFPEGLTITDGAGAWTDYAGCRVLSFGGVPAEEVLERMSEYRGVDNAMTWKWMGPQFYVRRLGLLREVGVETSDGEVELVLLDPEGTERRVAVEAGDFELVRKLRPSPAATGSVPRYLSAVDANFWMEPLPEHGAVYFQFNQVRDAPDESLAAFAERLRAALAPEDVRAVVVDVRHNNGGNNSLVRPLVRALVEFDLRSPEHEIVVLMGRNTFSAAQNFINHVERWTDAVFVGEPSSSSPNFVGEERLFVLPYSRIRGSLSDRYWQDSNPGDDRSWIAPDIPVELTAEDYFSNADPALDAVLELLSRGS